MAKLRNSLGLPKLVRQIAPTDPLLAWRLWNSSATPQIFRIKVRLISGAVGETGDGSTADGPGGETFCQDFAIFSIRYQIRRNAAFTGSIWKGQADVNNALNSGIDMQLRIEKCPKFDIVGDDTPIELVADPPGTPDSECQFPYGFIAPACSALHAYFTNTRGFPPAEGPVDIILAFRGVSIGCDCDGIAPDDAILALRGAGLYPLSPMGRDIESAALPGSVSEEAREAAHCGLCCPNKRRVVEVATLGFDPDRQGIGAGPGPGNSVSSRLFIPQAPTLSFDTRYSFILCGIRIPAGATFHLLGYAQKLTIGGTYNSGGVNVPTEFLVNTPDFAFPDGNIAWSINFLKGKRQTANPKPPNPVSPFNAGPSKSTDPYITTPALLYNEASAFTYIPPASGQFFGDPVTSPGTFYDLRSAWLNAEGALDIPITGPGDLFMVASVWQTNPHTRPALTGFPGHMSPEDKYLRDAEAAGIEISYRHIGARMFVGIE